MSFFELDTWMEQYVRGRPAKLEGRIVWLLDGPQGKRRTCAVLKKSGCTIDGEEPEGVPKLLVTGKIEDLCSYLKTADQKHLESMQFRGDPRLWATLVELAQKKLSPLALRAGKSS